MAHKMEWLIDKRLMGSGGYEGESLKLTGLWRQMVPISFHLADSIGILTESLSVRRSWGIQNI